MDKRILPLLEQINSNLQSPPTIEEMSVRINVSPSRFRQMFKTEAKLSFGEYVRHLRMERARELLEMTFMRVQEIGVAVGFRDQSYFDRAFKEKYGLTPKKYRDENHREFKKLSEKS